MDDKITNKTISLIPSAAVRNYLSEHAPDWTVMQAATVIFI